MRKRKIFCRGGDTQSMDSLSHSLAKHKRAHRARKSHRAADGAIELCILILGKKHETAERFEG